MKNWLDEKTWFDKKNVEYKKLTLQSLGLLSSIHETRSDKDLSFLFKDVDIASYVLSQYLFQHNDLLKYKELKVHLDDEKKALYILNNGCLDNITKYIFIRHPQLLEDKKIIEKFATDNPRSLHFFEKQITPDILKDLLKKKKVSENLLAMFPGNLKISKLLLAKGIFPHYHTHQNYAPEVFSDRKLIQASLKKSMGYNLYGYLPEKLQFDPEYCDIVERYHPHVKVKVSTMRCTEDYLERLKNPESSFTNELYAVIGNMEKLKFIKEDPYNLLKVLDLFTDGSYSCYVELMGDPHFASHPMQDFFKNIDNMAIKEFIKTDFGDKMVNYQIKNYSDFTKFEKVMIPRIHQELRDFMNKYSTMNHLSDSLPQKDKITLTNKI